MKAIQCIAFDLGASNGRAMLGRFDGKTLSVHELHRFANEPVYVQDGLYWDVLRLYLECSNALTSFAAKSPDPVSSAGVDSWGTSFGLIDRNGNLISNPFHYRDKRIDGVRERASEILSEEELFNLTGSAAYKTGTLYQLLSMLPTQKTILDNAHTMLLMPDLLAYFFTGEKATEYTNATTTQLVGKDRASWSGEVLNAFGLPGALMPFIQQPGERKGKIKGLAFEDLPHPKIEIIATATHDTAAAVAAIPDLDQDSAFLSSGTWSLIGVETDELCINESAFRAEFTNEGGVGGRNLLLRNTVGMWIIQECAREWRKMDESTSFDGLVSEAARCAPFKMWIDPDCGDFQFPGDMPQKIRRYCERTGQPIPETTGQITRCVFESMALKYRWCFETLESLAGRPLNALRIVGGGSKNGLLNQFIANAIQKPVVCGPAEATAIGNIMVQLKAFGEVSSLEDIRRIVSASFESTVYEPQAVDGWDDAYERYLAILKKDERI